MDQIDQGRKRLQWTGPERTAKRLLRFFRSLGKERTTKPQLICSDMCQAYVKMIAQKAPQRIHILDLFHVMQMMSKAIDKVRAAEVKQRKADGYEPALKGSRWLLLKRPENLNERQAVRLKELLQRNFKSVRSHVMKEDFPSFWEYTDPGNAGKLLDPWCTRAMRSQIKPMKPMKPMKSMKSMKSMAKTLRNQRGFLLNWFRAGGKPSSGVVEGFSSKQKRITRKSYGLRTQKAYETALYHHLGDLPEPEFTHRFY